MLWDFDDKMFLQENGSELTNKDERLERMGRMRAKQRGRDHSYISV